jgi:hypothetical protein
MGIIFDDTAISATPLHLTKSDEEPNYAGAIKLSDQVLAPYFPYKPYLGDYPKRYLLTVVGSEVGITYNIYRP